MLESLDLIAVLAADVVDEHNENIAVIMLQTPHI